MFTETNDGPYEAPRIIERTCVTQPLIGVTSKPTLSAEFRHIDDE
jgi:hypothetical protein